MKKILLFLVIMSVLLVGCQNKELYENTKKLTVAVSIIPQETFVKAVGGDLINVVTMIPPGASPTNYQPTIKQMTNLSDSKLYFSIGVPAEQENILTKINDFSKDIQIVNLQDIVEEQYPHRNFEKSEQESEKDYHDHEHEGIDPHIWMSPKRVKVIISTIKDELIKLDPNNAEIYNKNAQDYIANLNILDEEIKNTLSNIEKQSFIIFHPSMGYFAEDYGMNMISIEESGKEATAKRIREVIDFAKENNIKFIFYQEEFDGSQASTIADEIDGETIKISPLSPNYIENLKDIAKSFKEVLK